MSTSSSATAPIRFPIGTAVLFGLVMFSIYQALISHNWTRYTTGLIVTGFIAFVLYIVLRPRLERMGKYTGGFLFASIIAVLMVFCDQILTALSNVGVNFALVPLGPLEFLQINGQDYSWLLLVLIGGIVYFGRADFQSWLKGEF